MKKNGSEITQALQNIASFIKATLEFIFNDVFKPIIFQICQVKHFIWPAGKDLFVSLLLIVLGVIQGAFYIILGVVKLLSRLFIHKWRGVCAGLV
ncbi:hypothetical protein, partial [Staphylococcus aureus]|uniref:hypothetical protein n=1 Tax=Staphylococcus aureus TaxID=1280 RepID=UPI0021088034